MASIVSRPDGRKWIQFFAPDRKRKTLRLGKLSLKQAEAFKVKLQELIGQTITGVVEDEVSRWVAALDDRMYRRLAKVGLNHRAELCS